MTGRHRAVTLLLPLLLAACAAPRGPAPARPSSFEANQLLKNDIDRVCEAHRQELFASLKLLAEKLYRRNPREWKKSGATGPETLLTRLFDPAAAWHFNELDGREGVDAVQLALRADYTGDRVFALVAGLGGMLHAAFNGKTAFFMTDELDPQKLYNAARNVEIAVWKLSNDRGVDGGVLLLTNDAGPPANLSFEREFGKMIGNLDTLSIVVAARSDRTVVKVLQIMASAVFLPVAMFK
jgi:hypothetical protein